MWQNSMTIKTIVSTNGIEQATTAPARKPRLKKLTKRTIINASSSDFVNSAIFSSTTIG